MSPLGLFVTGTDTGVGKTLIACALLHALVRAGRRAVGMKPVAAGAVHGPAGLVNDDVARLRAAGNVDAPLTLVNPYCFEAPIAPHIAAARTGVTIDVERILHAYGVLAAMADAVIVEGAGGFRVPLNHGEDSADLARRLGLPVVLVVGLRLGCLNHALLTAEAVRARGLKLAGWVANDIGSGMTAMSENVAALKTRLPEPLLAEVGFMAAPDAGLVGAGIAVPELI